LNTAVTPGLGPQRNAAAVFTGVEVDAADASSVLVIRNSRASVDVLMIERDSQTDFAAGACVFPGGRVTEVDRTFPHHLFLAPDLEQLRTTIGAANVQEAVGLLVAAVRETFEETGVLLARRSSDDHSWVDQDLLDRPETHEFRRSLARRGSDIDWTPWVEDHGLVLDLRSLVPWSWWVTPRGQHRRYDTRFFVTEMPPGQEPTADNVEAVKLRFSSPADFLRQQASGKLKIIFPTRRNLMGLVGLANSQAVMQAARSGLIDRRRTEPRIEHIEGAVFVVHPFDGVMEQI
jgi:8-oxo-dGTP pyrophosphatase MutT (NUDIX family)